MAPGCQPVLYDVIPFFASILTIRLLLWDSEEVLVHQVVSMKKMNEKPGHVRPANGFYDKLNALKFVPQQELSREQAYWLPANERASQTSNPNSPGIIKDTRTNTTILISYSAVLNQSIEVKEYEQIFDDLDAEYKRCVLDNKNLTIEKKNLLIQNDCLIANYLEKDICSIMLASDIVVPPSSNCLCKELRSNCDREHSKVVELEAEILKKQQMLNESEKRFKGSASRERRHHPKLANSDQHHENVEGSFDKQALETELTQLKDALTSVKIQIDGYRAENANLK
ncbi:hypothetical protein Tco_0855138 [Tanacetum coccineum]